MKKIFKKIMLPSVLALLLCNSGCNDFNEINVDPYLAYEHQVQVEYLINNSIISAQQDPHIAERVFVLYWKTAGRQQWSGGISVGNYDDGWSSDYYGASYMSAWLNHIFAAIELAEKKEENGTALPYNNNQLQVARIWRAYLMSELSDNFGPIPLDGFRGQNPTYSDVKSVYYYLLDELKDASSKIDLNVTGSLDSKYDQAYGFNYAKWQRYANSMRLRLAMRLSEVDPTKAQSEFEDAVKLPLITTLDETMQIQELEGWGALAGVMSREWNHFILPSTINNIYLGLGGIKSEDQLDASMHAAIKPENYVGLKLDDHFTTKTNDPSAGYWLDGLPHTIDPRAYKTYIIPGDFSNPDFNAYPSWDNTAKTVERVLVDNNGDTVLTINATNHWNGSAYGSWGTKGAKNRLYNFQGTMPRHGQQFRNGKSQRIFFASWETYFLMAEAAVRGWAVPMTGKAAYELGISRSFEYWDKKNLGEATPSSFLNQYLSSTQYNRVGTSVSWDHVTEPPATYTITYVNGYNGTAGSTTRTYPKNDLYKNGSVKNDLLTKIITQKFIAQNVWLPLETWNDQRRLGLPFFDNPAVEEALVNLPALNGSNFMTSNIKFFPQRLRYPSGLANANAAGYQQAVSLLGGPDAILTPLWWAKQN